MTVEVEAGGITLGSRVRCTTGFARDTIGVVRAVYGAVIDGEDRFAYSVQLGAQEVMKRRDEIESISHHRLVAKLDVDNIDGKRRIHIDGELFPYYTNGPIMAMEVSGGWVVHIPLFVPSDAEVTTAGNPIDGLPKQ